MTVFRARSDRDFEQIVISDSATDGLTAFIAIHDTSLGPALGGCRMWPYASERDALDDAKRLARGMTYKAAVAGLPLGGGKAVIMADPANDKSPALWRGFASLVNRLSGRYITAEDVGTTVEDMAELAQHTPYVAGRPEASGDPSPMTAYGVYRAIRTAVTHKFGESDLKDLGIAVQGLGHVGFNLCRMLHRDGARLTVTDVSKERVVEAVAAFGATVVAPDAIYDAPVDVFAPCALGGVISEQTVHRLRAGVVAGAANNQLADPTMDLALAQRGILYAPDYVINAGGLISIANDALNPDAPYDRAKIAHRVGAIGDTLAGIIQTARDTGLPTAAVADRLAESRIQAARDAKSG